MKRNWICGLCATIVAGGAIAFAQQERGGLPPPVAPQEAGALAPPPVQELPPVGVAGTAPAGAINLPPPTAASTAPANSDPFGLPSNGAPPPFGVQSADPFSGTASAGTTAPAQGGSRNFGGGQGAASSFGPTSGPFGQGGRFDGPSGRFGGGSSAFGAGSFGGGMTMPGQNMTSMMMSKEAREYRDAENGVQQIATRLRHTAKDDPAADKLKEELKAAVTKAFEARQAQQAAEVKRLKEKLAEIEATVTRREKIKEDLILERMSELTSGGGDFFGGVSGTTPFGSGAFPILPPNDLPKEAPAKAFDAPVSTTPARP
jgi:hypothetical protein